MANQSHHPGRIKFALAQLLQEKGIEITAYDLHDAKGYYRIYGHHEDVYKWDGWGKWANAQVFRSDGSLLVMPPDVSISLVSWNTMSDCVRYGITIEPEYDDSPISILVTPVESNHPNAKPPGKRKLSGWRQPTYYHDTRSIP